MNTETQTWTADQQKAIEKAHLKGQPDICPNGPHLLIIKIPREPGAITALMVTCRTCGTFGQWKRGRTEFRRWTPVEVAAHKAGRPYCSVEDCGAKVRRTVHNPHLTTVLCPGCGNYI